MRAACGPAGCRASCACGASVGAASAISSGPARGVAPALGKRAEHASVRLGATFLRQQPAHRAHVRHDLPRLCFRDASAERRHAVGPSIHDGGEDRIGLASVDPLVVHEGRPHVPAALRVTPRAVVPAIPGAALRHFVGVALAVSSSGP
jgi:hypothetical protein